MSNKVPLLSWSGGVDSTANVIYYFSKCTPFETVYVKLPNNEKQQIQELKARKRIIKKLTSIFGNYHLKDTEIEFVGTLGEGAGSLVQPYIWATSISYNISFEKYSSLVFGYIREDDFWHVKADFETLIHASHRLLLAKGPVPQFKYPLEWHTKQSVIETYYYYDKRVREVLDLTHVCEERRVKACGICKKCLELKTAIKATATATATAKEKKSDK